MKTLFLIAFFVGFNLVAHNELPPSLDPLPAERRTEIIALATTRIAAEAGTANYIQNRVIARWGADNRLTPRATEVFNRMTENIDNGPELERLAGLLVQLIEAVLLEETVAAERPNIDPSRMFNSASS